MKKYKIVLAVLAVVMILSLSVQGAMAYFTTYVRVKGTIPLNLHEKTTITEEVVEGEKIVTISNTGTVPVYVRAKAIAPSTVTLKYNTDSNPDWTDGGDGWWYYGPMLMGGSEENPTQASPLHIKIEMPENSEQTEINVVVLYEATHSIDNNGNAVWE